MTDSQLEYLRSLGLPPDASETEVSAFVDTLDDEQRTKFEGMATAASADDGAAAGAETQETVGAAASAGRNRVALSSKQIAEIRDYATLGGLGAEWALEQIALGRTPEQVRPAAIAARNAKVGNAPARATPRARVEVGEDGTRISLREGIRDAIMLRAGGERAVQKPHARAREFRGLRLASMARNFFEAIGLRCGHLADTEIAALAVSGKRQQQFMSRVALTNGAYESYYNTFDQILVDAQNVALQRAYAEAQPKWPAFCSKATAPDFKNVNRPRFNAMPPLTLTADGDVVVYGTFGDEAEVYALDNYSSGWVLTWQQVVNDQLDAFSKLPRMAAHKAILKQDNLAFTVLTSNPTMGAGGPLFSFANANCIYEVGAPSVAQLQKMQAKAMAQTAKTDSASDPLDLTLGVLIVPATLDATTRQVAFSTVDPASSGAAANPYVNEWVVVSSARLTGTAYYGAVKPGTLCDTIEVCFLEGFETPRVDMEEDFDSIAQKFRLYQPLKAKALDHRGLVKVTGSTSASLT